MTIDKIFEDLLSEKLSVENAINILNGPDHKKSINYFIHRDVVTKEPMNDGELAQLNALVNVLKILYNSEFESPVSDQDYDTLQEMLIDSGIPRITSDYEINDLQKISHTYTSLRGTLKKVYYLTTSEQRTNPSRKYLDEWKTSMEAKYKKATGNDIDLDECTVIVSPKFDGVSVVLEKSDKMTWLTRGNTTDNLASDVTHIMRQFNDLYSSEGECGIKFELMVTEEDKDIINELSMGVNYHNSRQIVTATLTSNEVDFKSQYLYPVALRKMFKGQQIETIHDDMFTKFPYLKCKLKDRDKIREFALANKLVELPTGFHLRTDGAVITITDPKVQEALGRENNINNFEIAYKFTEEAAYTYVKGIEFYVSGFGYITPVVVTNDVVLKGNTINHITISNRERFDELDLHYGDMVKVLYDIIPYLTIDESCIRSGKDKIEFVKQCPTCGSELDLIPVRIQCPNPDCPSKEVGKILNWCENLRISEIGEETVSALIGAGLLKHGIRSLYKLKGKRNEIEDIPGFGRLKSTKIIREIEAKRRLKDYEVFGSLGIEALSLKTFRSIFAEIPYSVFIELAMTKNKHKELSAKLQMVKGIKQKANNLVAWLSDADNRKELKKLLEVLSVQQTFGDNTSNGIIAFTKIRPSKELEDNIKLHGFEIGDSVTAKTTYLITPDDPNCTSGNVAKAKSRGIPILMISDFIKALPTLKGNK